jgi:hypothetical protein
MTPSLGLVICKEITIDDDEAIKSRDAEHFVA